MVFDTEVGSGCFQPTSTHSTAPKKTTLDPTDAAAVFEARRLRDARLVLLAVNDNPNASAAEGGSHWCASLCVCACVL